MLFRVTQIIQMVTTAIGTRTLKWLFRSEKLWGFDKFCDYFALVSIFVWSVKINTFNYDSYERAIIAIIRSIIFFRTFKQYNNNLGPLPKGNNKEGWKPSCANDFTLFHALKALQKWERLMYKFSDAQNGLMQPQLMWSL